MPTLGKFGVSAEQCVVGDDGILIRGVVRRSLNGNAILPKGPVECQIVTEVSFLSGIPAQQILELVVSNCPSIRRNGKENIIDNIGVVTPNEHLASTSLRPYCIQIVFV